MKLLCTAANQLVVRGLFFFAAPLFAQAQGTTLNAQSSPVQTGSRPPTVSVKEGKEHLMKRFDIMYPPIASAAHVTGIVVIGAEISVEGDVITVVPISGPEMLRGAAADAVKQYKYRPFIINGVPTVVRTAVQVTFNPGHTKSGD